MFKPRLKLIYSLTLSAVAFSFGMNVFAEELGQKETIVIQAKNDISIPLRDVPIGARYTNSISNKVKSVIHSGLVTIHAFEGIGKSLPGYVVTTPSPKVNGNIGVGQFLEWVDPDIAVFDAKTGAVMPGFPKPGNAIWFGFGGPCETSDSGDPKVKFDQLAQRWVITRQAYANINTGPFYQCVAVSTSKDATGSWYRYAFPMDSLNDFGTIALWPDGYYLAVTMFGPTIYGPRACALDRSKMLIGLPATAQCKQFTNNETPTLRPTDLGGKLQPPMAMPAFFFSISGDGELLFFKFHTDWNNPANTTIKGKILPVQVFQKACAATGGRNCVVQPDTDNRLDLLADRFGSRIVYYQFLNNLGSLVAIHNVQGAAPKLSPAIRWYEFRLDSTDPTFELAPFQTGTLEPDSKARFNGSIGLDYLHNIAVGYTVSSTAVHPSPELAYRNYYDPLNSLTVQPLYTSHGSQLDIPNWSSYAQMSLDPLDLCTFWFVGEYLDSSGSFNWSTIITHFKLAGCP